MFEFYYSIGPQVDAVSPALSRQSMLWGNPPPPDHRVPIPIKGGSCWCNNVVTLSLVVFSALKLFFLCFCILLRSVGFYSFIWIIFSKFTKLKKILKIKSRFNLTLLLLNCLWIFFIHLKQELLTQFPASNEWKVQLFIKNERVPNLFIGLTKLPRIMLCNLVIFIFILVENIYIQAARGFKFKWSHT